MATISQFTVGSSRTINLGNFESLRVEASVTTDLNDGEHWSDKVGEAHGALRKLMEETYLLLTKKKGIENEPSR